MVQAIQMKIKCPTLGIVVAFLIMLFIYIVHCYDEKMRKRNGKRKRKKEE